MATFSFDGSASRTINFNATVDRAVLDLNVDELASLSENRDTNTVSIVATSGAVLTLVGTNFAALRANDALVAGFDSDIVLDIGTDGFNSLEGNVVVGLGTGDEIEGTNGDDLLFGNQGSDLIEGGRGSDRLYGGLGNDTLTARADGNDATQTTLAVGGLGSDSIEIAGSFANNNADAAFNASGAAYVGSATVFGGNEAGDPLDGDDRIGVRLGDTGSALIYGNGGADRIVVTGNGDVSVFGGLGNDTVDVTADSALVYGGLGGDTITVALATAGDSATVYGGNGADDTADGADIISVTGGAGTSATVYGNAGNDVVTLDGGATSTGRFEVYAGQGNDVVTGDLGNGSVVYGGLGIDNIDVDVFSTTPASVTVYGGNGSADAADGADIIQVSVGAGVTNGVAGDDSAIVYGNGGNDVIVVTSQDGGAGQATVYGGAGNDTIDAGDVLDAVVFGGVGNDVFLTSDTAAAIADGSAVTVADFTLGQDRVDFGATPTTSVQTITTAANVQIDDIADASGQVNFLVGVGGAVAVRVTSGDLAGSTVIFGDADGAPGGDGVIVLSGFTGNLTTADFA